MSFRLPLTPFEQYALTDDSRRHPMGIAFRLRISGLIDTTVFESAVVCALQRHPLLRAVLDDSEDHLHWINSDLDPSIRWFGAETEFDQSLVFDLKSAPGLRILCQIVANGCEITFQFHHACSDGIGGFAFIDDVLVAYHNKWCQFQESPAVSSVTPVDVDPDVLTERGNISQKRSRWTFPYRIGIGVGRAIRFLTKQPMQIAGGVEAVQSSGVADNPTPGNRDDFAFPIGFADRLRQSAAERASTLNDVLLATAFETLFDWQSNRSESSGLIRLGVPVNLRSARHAKLPAANVVSITFLDRNADQMTDRNKLLAGITRQMNGIKSRKSATFVRVMRYLGNHKRLRHLVRSDRVFISATVSNLGPVLARSPLPRSTDGRLCFGSAIVDDVDVQGPVRGTMTVFFAIFSYAGRLKSCLAYDTETFQKTDAAELNAEFAARLQAIDGNVGSAIPVPHPDAVRSTRPQRVVDELPNASSRTV